jgi:flagellar motor protein MotB
MAIRSIGTWESRQPFGVLAVVLALAIALAGPATVGAQAPVDTVGVRAGGALIHPVAGIMAGRFDVHAGPRLDVAGARLGVGWGQLFQLTAFYWRAVDTGERELLPGEGWGGEAQLNLSTGFGLTPFVTTGLARVDAGTIERRNAALLGAGLLIPLGPIQISVSARDYVLGISGLDNEGGTGEASHNWLFSAGVGAALGQRRAREPVTVVRAPAPGTVDTVWLDPLGQPIAPHAAPAGVPGQVVETGVRTYQSDRTLEVPIPTEGTIILRYGPEAARIGAGLVDLFAHRPPTGEPGAAAAATAPDQPQAGPVLSEAVIQRIIEGTVAAILPRLEARDAERQDRLRADLMAALTAQRDAVLQSVRQELARRDIPTAAPPPAPAAAPVQPVPAPAPLADRSEEIRRAADRLAAARAELAQIEAARPVAEPRAPGVPTAPDQRTVLVELAARHPALLTTAELDRGPALVITDRAFEGGSALLDERARPVFIDVAEIVRHAPGAIYVQGHMDSAGPEVRNQQFSELRAEVVRSLLVQAGVDPGRIHAVGFGAGRPVASNETEAGRAQNRRVEIVIGQNTVNEGP